MLSTESSPNGYGQVVGGYNCSKRAWGTRLTIKCLDTYRSDERAVATCCFLLLCVTACTRSWSVTNIATPLVHTKPYRVLLVVEHWSDPYGVVVGSEADKFQPVAALLKAWSIPFDILRLDQQHLDATYLFRRSGGSRYGAVVWLADPASYGDQDLASLEEATRAGTGLIVVDSRALDSTLGKLLGLKFKDFYTSTDVLQVTKEHFITRDVTAGKNAPPVESHDYSTRLWVQPINAEVLIAQSQHGCSSFRFAYFCGMRGSLAVARSLTTLLSCLRFSECCDGWAEIRRPPRG
jgi:hypothetical protein